MSASSQHDSDGDQPLVADSSRQLNGRVSTELNPLSLTNLFAQDPECAAKHRERAQPARSMQFAGSQLDHELELRKLQVFVRIRPSVTAGAPHPAAAPQQPGQGKAGWQLENCVHATSKCAIAIAPPEASQAYKSGDRGQTYSFSRVFDCDTSQLEYYEQTAGPLVRDLLRNKQHNSVMMAYGITAAGKTYTIEGTKEAPGVMPRALVELFQGLGGHAEAVAARASYFEVYNEQLYDLLEEQPAGSLAHRPSLKLKEDSMGRVFVAGLSEVQVGTAGEALALLRRGSRQRQRAETGLNYSSSRSHSIFTVTLYQQGAEREGSPGVEGYGCRDEEEAGSEAGEQKLGRIAFVDLAGSERAQRTGNVGVRLKESVAINSSLMTLGRCLEVLRWNQQHKGAPSLRVVPYRESKVTHLFRDALHGWGQVLLSVNVSPVARDYDETSHVLKYAALATQIGTIQQAEAPRRTIKAVSPAIRKVKRKAALPPEARRGAQGGRGKRAKKAGGAAPAALPAWRHSELAAVPEAAEPESGEECGPQAQERRPDSPPGTGLVHRRVGQQGGDASDLSSGLEAGDGKDAWLAAADNGAAAEEEEEEEEEGGAGEGGELSDFGTPSTPVGEEGEAVAALQAQVQHLIADLQAAQERCVVLEAEVREEVAEEMAQLLRDMEESYQQRMAAAVQALERKQVAAVAEIGRRRKERGGKGGNNEDAGAQLAAELAADLAAAQDSAAEAAAEAEQLREQASRAECQLAGAQQQLTEVACQLEEVRAQAAAQAVQGEQDRAQAAQHTAGLESAAASAQLAVSEAEQQLAAERARAAETEAELAAARQQAEEVQANLAAKQRQVSGLQADLAAARQQAAATQVELAAAQQQAASLEADLAAARDVAEARHHQSCERYEAQLQEVVTQLEANRGMELEMAEGQGERLRKDNLALQHRLQAALAALAAYGSPLAGPGGMAARMAQAAPEGAGRGAGGTPHDIALARARQAAAADDMAAAAAAPGGSTLPRSRTRFACAAESGGSAHTGEHHAAATVAAPHAGLESVREEVQEEAAQSPQQAQQQHDQQAQQAQQQHEAAPAAGRPPGKPRKAVAFAALQQDADRVPGTAAHQEQQAPPAARQESRRGRRLTRAAAAALSLSEVALLAADLAPAAATATAEQAPALLEQADTAASAAPVASMQPAAAPALGQRGRRRTQAVPAAAAVRASELQAASQTTVAQAELPPLQPSQQAAVSGPDATCGPTGAAAGQGEEEDVPLMASVTFHQLCDRIVGPSSPEKVPPAAAVEAARPRRRGRAPLNKENSSRQYKAVQPSKAALAADSKAQGAVAREEAGAGKQRRKLLPGAPTSVEMRVALGELEESMSLRQHVANKQKQAAAAAAAGGPEAGGKRSRRQTQFFRL
ncbi:hypothetical protein D9Q98_000836 [Chlorella vulgaris]|uniref:Kinesin motor domain-containing protein n=1 Tax=Chlorella vulgaris TaxID=3077 RepID=A0A9D4TZT5_CHLVU|nr:hypothetical protein D9Q98_000836 [Chlorella vulgaris]